MIWVSVVSIGQTVCFSAANPLILLIYTFTNIFLDEFRNPYLTSTIKKVGFEYNGVKIVRQRDIISSST